MTYRGSTLLLAVLLILHFGAYDSRAQAALTETNTETTVSEISFKFGSTKTFLPTRLAKEIATTAPGVLYGIQKIFSFLPFVNPSNNPLAPVELQRDVVRLRQFYANRGFLHADINFFASQFDRGANSVHIIFSIQEGPPLHVMRFDIQGMDNLETSISRRWEEQSRRITFPDSGRYSSFESTRIENGIVTFLQNSGFPFAAVTLSAQIDSTLNEVRVLYTVDTGPRARIAEIVIDGNISVSDRIVLRELPFSEGEYFSRYKLSQGQRDIFAMNLFRYAVAELPDQPVDSLVTVRYRVGESNRRSISLAAGYSRELGLGLEGSLTHRNFFGDARAATLSAITETGLFSNPGNGKTDRKSTILSLSVRQPFLFRRGFSLTLAPFYNSFDDPNQNTDYYKLGATGTFLWQLLEYRNATFEYTHSRSVPRTGRGTNERFDLFDVNTYAVGVTVGKLDDYLNPTKGFLLNPRWEASGTIFSSGLNYRKGTVSGRLFVPVTRGSNLSLMLNYGLMVPLGSSVDQDDPETEFRFDPVRFYAGGSNDVRGWGLNELGAQIAVGDSVFIDDNGTFRVRNPLYEAVGGEAKLSGSAEYRFPVPWMPNALRIGVFMDFGLLSARFRDDTETTPFVRTSEVIVDDGNLRAASAQFGGGGGIRYATPVGSVRFDVAYKLNPSFTDLRNPEDIILFREGFTRTPPPTINGRRWRIHLSLDRAF